ncbi:flagellin [Phaeobacter inhibens]|uniref:flagellin N-terminal helical domain-containing protein n=1 Tax=Phaeobacter inhibens TaxID=221822 RepID=UPI00076BBE08|nr:flagellin [Phaeobacter inhibens]KXF88603.1 flagellin [Phaeobacter inhibens]WHP68555.1 flagellin [Phaeobacter inhibens]
MSSILTNNGAMVALQTLQSVNNSLDDTQSQISTGKRIGSAKDNAAVWAISKTMDSDIAGYKSVQESLGVGEATVAVALSGAEQIVETLTEMKQLAISANSENVDHSKIQDSIAKKAAQITSIIESAEFNGANLLKTADLTVLGGLDPAADTITVGAIDAATNIDVASMTAITDVATGSTALTEIETLLGNAIDAAAQLGADSNRLGDQSMFVSKLSDSLTMGVSTMTDTNMEESSARLKALQTQQQLAVQSLSIANQAPQTLMQLFR